jgi:integration host factor subunit beta
VTKSELIALLEHEQAFLRKRDVEFTVNALLRRMSDALAAGELIEIRGSGSFTLRFRAPRTGRNPKTGRGVASPACCAPHFKPGRELRDRVNAAMGA